MTVSLREPAVFPQVNLKYTFIHMPQVGLVRAKMVYFQFFKDIATKIECPEYNILFTVKS